MKMFLEKLHSEGLSHLSYIIGHGGRAAVIDPRRDCDVYPEMAARNGTAVTHIFETPGHTYESISISVADRSFGDCTIQSQRHPIIDGRDQNLGYEALVALLGGNCDSYYGNILAVIFFSAWRLSVEWIRSLNFF